MFASHAATHAQGIAELLNTELGIHVVGFHDLHDSLHERTGALQHFFLVGLDTLGHAVLVALLVVEDILDARLQMGWIVALFQGVTDGIEQLFCFLALQSGHPPIIYIEEEGHENDTHEQAEPPTVPEGWADDNLDGGNVGLLDRGRRHVAHLEGVVASGQGTVAYGVLAQTEGCPFVVETLHPITEHGLLLVAIIQGGEGYGERTVGLAQLDGTGNRDVVREIFAACRHFLIIYHQLGEDEFAV